MFRLSLMVVFAGLMLFAQQIEAADRILVKTTPSGARVFLNSVDTRRMTPAKVPLKLGDLVELRLPGYKVHRLMCGSSQAPIDAKLQASDSFKLTIATRTGKQTFAGTDGVILALSPNGDPNHRVQLDNPGTEDFEPGSIDSFSFDFELPLSELKGLLLAMEKGNDAWFCDSVKLQFETENGSFKSRPLVIPVKTWLCHELKDKSVKKRVDLQIKQPKLFVTGLK